MKGGMLSLIYINGRFLNQFITGVQRYAIELVKALDDMLENGTLDKARVSFVILTPKQVNHEINLRNISLQKVGRLRGHLWEQIELPIYSRKYPLLNFCNIGPIFKGNQIVTIHDASVFSHPHGYSYVFRMWYRFLLPILGRNSRGILTNSEFSKFELIKYCDIPSEKIISTHLGVDGFAKLKADDAILSKHGLNETSYIFAVSSMNPNKNFAALIKAIGLLGNIGFKVVIAGGTNPRVFGECNLQLPDSVVQVGYVSDAELQALYKHATCFVFPSLYEGFGLPPLEAMAAGCPVIASNAGSLPEVCDDAVVYCDPYSPRDIAQKIKYLMDDAILRDKLRIKGLKQAQQFTWKKCARETAAVIEQALL